MTKKRVNARFWPTAVLLAAFLPGLAAAQPAASTPATTQDVQREAMRKLAFLTGCWSGPITVFAGSGEPLHLTQTENVQYKLDGLLLLIEGKATSAENKNEAKEMFSALATVSFDDATHTYRFRAYHDGHYLDTELSVPDNGFSWSYTAGPAQIVNSMHLTEKGEWSEATDVTVGSNPPHRSVDMLLQHQP